MKTKLKLLFLDLENSLKECLLFLSGWETVQSPCLGAHFDSRMIMEEFMIKKCRACQLQLHKIDRICKYLSTDTFSCIIQGLVTSKLDYANCLLYGVNKVSLHRLQIVQNSEARVILKIRKYDHVSRARQELHWLFPVKVPQNSYGKQAFVHAAPTLWNNLPVRIRSSNALLDFRRQLKT